MLLLLLLLSSSLFLLSSNLQPKTITTSLHIDNQFRIRQMVLIFVDCTLPQTPVCHMSFKNVSNQKQPCCDFIRDMRLSCIFSPRASRSRSLKNVVVHVLVVVVVVVGGVEGGVTVVMVVVVVGGVVVGVWCVVV